MISRQSHSARNSKNWTIQDFQIIKVLGRGKFGEVKVARELSSDFIVALKIMKKTDLEDNNYHTQTQREIAIQSSLNHPNILKLYGYFWDSTSVVLVLEYAPKGQLFSILKKTGKLSQPTVAVIIRQICQGVSYLHQKKVIHRDLKPQNILISSDSVKIGDFGWAVASESRRSTFCGTLDYLSPEMLRGENHDSRVDIWALGILTFQLSTGSTPFEEETYVDTLTKIVQDSIHLPTDLSPEVKKFIRRCLQKDPRLRPSAAALLQDVFIRKYWGLPLQL